MNLARGAGSLVVVAVAAVGMAVLPAASSQASPVPFCPAVVGVCTWTGAAYEGELRTLFQSEPGITPPARSVSNRDQQSWCFYGRPFFNTQGETREVARGEAVSDLGFDVHSAQQGQCPE
ncbi:peptidase inhibitor family I36 protein [Streptomyces griseus]|uniref:peptidase inhibitor family I36 protein n=1 Tax=Streptomyces TaxID=1883 RepID=UPI002FF30FF8